MKCQNCGSQANLNNSYYRAGGNKTPFCSKECCYTAYEGYYSDKEIAKTLERYLIN